MQGRATTLPAKGIAWNYLILMFAKAVAVASKEKQKVSFNNVLAKQSITALLFKGCN